VKTIDPRALNPNLKFGRGILPEAGRDWGDYLLVTQPEALSSAEKMLLKQPSATHFVTTMERAAIEEQSSALARTETIVGLGGGAALDFAKFVGWKQGTDPVLVPGAASVDAGVCNSIAVREDNKVRYIGFAVAKEIICDFDLMQAAPKNINRAGIGDILSIHTALWDWKLAATRGKAEYNQEHAKATAALVDQLEARAGEIYKVSDQALEWLMRAYATENAVCIKNRGSRPEEGSEHFFAYNVESLTKRSFIHGELVCLGVLLLSRLQENEVERVERILSQTGVRFQPAQLKLSKAEVEKALTTLKVYAENEHLVYSVVNERPVERKTLKIMCKDLKF